MSWWDRPLVEALIRDLVLDELRRRRPGDGALALDAAAHPVQLDSLERMQVADRLASFFQMREVGLEDNLLATTTLAAWVSIVLASLEHYDRAIGFRTSGSTGEPQTQVHALTHLQREVTFWAELAGDRQQVAGVVPRHHIYGFLFTVLLPRALQVDYLDLRGRLPRRLASVLPARTLLIGFPDFWSLLHTTDTPAFDQTWGVTSTAPLPDPLARALVPRPLTRLLHIYGSSETAGIGWRDSPDAPYNLLPHWRVEAGVLRTEGAAISPPDQLHWQDARHFQVRGRLDQAVAIGGINVYPERIARHLETHPEVQAARVRPMHPAEGARLKAFIQPAHPEGETTALRATLTAFCANTLAPMERPCAFTFGTHLPAGALGKTADWPLAGDAGDHPLSA